MKKQFTCIFDVDDRHPALYGQCILPRDDDGTGFALNLEPFKGKRVMITIEDEDEVGSSEAIDEQEGGRMSEQTAFDPRKVTRILYGCASYEEVWTPDIKEWGTPEEAYQNSVVSTTDYDALLRLWEEAMETLEDVLNQACANREGDGLIDSMALSAYRDGLLLCAKHGRFAVDVQVGRRVIGKWVETQPSAEDLRRG